MRKIISTYLCARTFKNKAIYVLFVQRLDWKSLCNHLITKYLINYLMMLMLCNCYIGGKSGNVTI